MEERIKTIDDFYARWNGKEVDLGEICLLMLMFILCVDVGRSWKCSVFPKILFTSDDDR